MNVCLAAFRKYQLFAYKCYHVFRDIWRQVQKYIVFSLVYVVPLSYSNVKYLINYDLPGVVLIT